MQKAYDKMGTGRAELADAITEMQGQRDLMLEAKDLMVSMRDDIPGVFDNVEKEYVKSIQDKHEDIENTYQKTLNHGFKNMYICVAIFNIIGMILLLFYRDDRRRKEDEQIAHGQVRTE